jgi:hypothetical protein
LIERGEVMSRLRSRGLLAAGSSALLLSSLTITDIAVATTEPAPEPRAVEILSPDESWGGATRGEWLARAWQRVVSLPAGVEALPATGERCGYGQFGPVFFLRGSFDRSEETCVVAEGTAVFVLVSGAECSTVEPPPFFGRDEEELAACAAAAVDETTEFQASLDGQDVADLEAYRATSPLFTLILPPNFGGAGAPAGVANSVAEAYCFIIAPPPPGQYEVAWSTRYGTDTYGGMVTLIVEAPQVIEPGGTLEPSTAPPSSEPTATSSVATQDPS